MDDLTRGRNVGQQPLPFAGGAPPDDPAADESDAADRVRRALADQPDAALGVAEDALRACPGEFELLLLAALAALAASQTMRAHAFLKRHQKRYVPGGAANLLIALAYAQQRQFTRAWAMLTADGIETFPVAIRWFI